MKSCFNSAIRITQVFGNDFLVNGNLYYKSMGINGHDGLDIVPIDKSDFKMYNIFKGIIVLKEFHKIYGNRIGIWVPEKRVIEYHNHMEEFNSEIKIKDMLNEKTYIGIMGQTGKVFGAHDHFAIARANEKGIRINRNNGYFGYIDPLPFLK